MTLSDKLLQQLEQGEMRTLDRWRQLRPEPVPGWLGLLRCLFLGPSLGAIYQALDRLADEGRVVRRTVPGGALRGGRPEMYWRQKGGMDAA